MGLIRAAVGATNAVSFLFFSLCNGIGSGGGIVTAQYFGAGDALKVRKANLAVLYIICLTIILYRTAVVELHLTALAVP